MGMVQILGKIHALVVMVNIATWIWEGNATLYPSWLSLRIYQKDEEQHPYWAQDMSSSKIKDRIN
jgi:hypothetical protein